MSGGDENDTAVGQAVNEATGRSGDQEHGIERRAAVVLGSGNLGLVYLMEEKRRLSAEEIEERHPDLIPALTAHPHIGFLLMRSAQHGAIAVGSGGTHYLATGRIEGEDPLEPFSANAAAHLRRTDGFEHVADIMVNSFYDPDLEQGCAFEELISFHGGLGGPQTRPFILYPVELPVPHEPIVVPPACTRFSRAGAACSREHRTPCGKPPKMGASEASILPSMQYLTGSSGREHQGQPASFEQMQPYHTRAKRLRRVHGARRQQDSTEPPASAP